MATRRKDETDEQYRARKNVYERGLYASRKGGLMSREQRSELNRAAARASVVARQMQPVNGAERLSPAQRAEQRQQLLKLLAAGGLQKLPDLRRQLPEALRPGLLAALRLLQDEGEVIAQTVSCGDSRGLQNGYRLPRRPDPKNPWLGLLA